MRSMNSLETITAVANTNNNNVEQYSPQRRLSAWLIHLFTASAAILGLFTLYAIYHAEYLIAFWLMGATIFIDSVDGTLARFCGVKQVVPSIDGALLDNIVDYLNYVITPAFLLLIGSILPHHWEAIGASAIVLASAYQFTQLDAKTPDHFFKGFPSYWSLALFYLFLGKLNPWFNLLIIAILVVLVFVPMKYVYLTRLDYVFRNKILKMALIIATFIYGVSTVCLLAAYPNSNAICVGFSWAFILLYIAISLYRTFVPMK